MRRFVAPLALLVGVAVAATAWGLELPLSGAKSPGGDSTAVSGNCGCGASRAACGSPCWCPDNYCPKPCPSVCLPPTCGRCDDYCAKPAPCVRPPLACGGCDDYCPKPAPSVRWPCRWPEFYKCLPSLPSWASRCRE